MRSPSFKHTAGKQIEITRADGSQIATYQFDKTLPKPCLHPLRTPAGHTITGFEMPDHIWHRGLWFAIKFINQTNFWEERPPFGIQKTEAEPQCELISENTIRIVHELQWTSEATGPVIHENRAIAITALSDGTTQIDWTTNIEAIQDLLLDRTPFTTWGGYGGLSFRASPELHNTSFLLPNATTVANILGQSHPWALLRAVIGENPESKISVGMIDHPQNPRSPIPWYCRSGNGYDVIFASFLFHEPMPLAKGHQLTLQHRVVYRDGSWKIEEFNKLADAYRNPTG